MQPILCLIFSPEIRLPVIWTPSRSKCLFKWFCLFQESERNISDVFIIQFFSVVMFIYQILSITIGSFNGLPVLVVIVYLAIYRFNWHNNKYNCSASPSDLFGNFKSYLNYNPIYNFTISRLSSQFLSSFVPARPSPHNIYFPGINFNPVWLLDCCKISTTTWPAVQVQPMVAFFLYAWIQRHVFPIIFLWNLQNCWMAI